MQDTSYRGADEAKNTNSRLVNLAIWLFDPNRDVAPREDIDAPCRRAGEQRALLLLSFLPF